MTAPLLCGLAVGLSLGLTGGGGSIFAVPLLVYVLGLPLRDAVIVSLAVVGTTSLFGAVVQARTPGLVLWGAGGILGLGGVLGAPFGARLGALLPERASFLLFAVVMVVIGLRMLRGPGAEIPLRWATCERGPHGLPHFSLACGSKVLVAGALTGLLSGLFGVGGGFLVVPALLVVTGVSIERALATSLVGIALISAAALAANLWVETRPMPLALALFFLGGSFLGMLAGTAGKRFLPAPALRRIFGGAVLAIAVWITVTHL